MSKIPAPDTAAQNESCDLGVKDAVIATSLFKCDRGLLLHVVPHLSPFISCQLSAVSYLMKAK